MADQGQTDVQNEAEAMADEIDDKSLVKEKALTIEVPGQGDEDGGGGGSSEGSGTSSGGDEDQKGNVDGADGGEDGGTSGNQLKRKRNLPGNPGNAC